MNEKKIARLKAKTVPIFRKYGVRRAGVFGSYIRGEAKKESDIDFFIIYRPGATLFDIGGLSYELKEKLGIEVDLADGRCLKKEIKPNILRDLKIIYN